MAAVAAVVVVSRSHIDPEGGERSIDSIGVACGLVGAAALALWRRAPVVMAAVVTGTLFAYEARNYTGGPALLPGPLALGLIGYRLSRAPAWTCAVVMAVVVVVAERIGEGRFEALGLAEVGWSLAAVFAGQLAATRRDRVAADGARRRLTEQQAMTQERLRIARDLHDSVAHAMATINVQAGAARHLMDRDDGQDRTPELRSALAAIRDASAEVLDELGVILGVLRRDDPDPGPGPRSPAADLSRVAELVERSRADGLAVSYQLQGDPRAVSAAVGAAAFRVVQESLSNTRRHAGPGTEASITVVVTGDGCRVNVLDGGGGPSPTSPPPPDLTGPDQTGLDRLGLDQVGLGLIGMRERVESTGGTFGAGARPDGGFAVVAEWPGRR